jgi:hypothetical protein
LNITSAGLGTISCGASGTTRIFTLNPVSNVGGTPNIKYNVTAPSGYTIAPTQGIYGQTTTFTLTKITGSAVGTGNLTVVVTDEINTNCTVNATVTDISCPCTINLTTNVSGCFDSNGNTPGGTSQATVQAIVDWQFNPTGQTINVTCTGATAQSINPATSAKPAILNFIVPANGSAVTVTATFSTTIACTATANVTAPAGTCIQTPCETGNTGGSVWRDFNNDGIKDANETAGVSGVTVTAYDCNGNVAATTTTDALGQYTFTTLTPSATNKYRIEFSGLPPQYSPTFNGTNGRTDVQIIAAASCGINYGVNTPTDYCQSNPRVIVPCFVNGSPLLTGPAGKQAALQAALVGVDYTATGPTPTEKVIGTAGNVGAVWGVAYQASSDKLFSAAFLKRHAGWGSLGSGGIYITNSAKTASPVSTTFVSLDALGFPTGGFSRYGFTGDITQPSTDVAAFTQIGKVGLGDLDISTDEKYLYVTNLFDRKVYRIFVNSPAVVPTAANVTSFSVPNPCSNGDYRPFAVKFHNNKVYVGVICSEESTQIQGNLSASVYEFNPDGTSPKLVLNVDLDYKHGYVWSDQSTVDHWLPWLSPCCRTLSLMKKTR